MEVSSGFFNKLYDYLYSALLILGWKIVILEKGKVMKDLVKKVESFITFGAPLQANYISIQFENIHHHKLSTIQTGTISLQI
jgi:hypothetical protein